MRNFGVLITSHGHFAEESLKVVEMIAGRQENVEVASLEEGMGIKEFKENYDNKFDKLYKKSDFVIVFVDIYGGTPFNTTTRAILEGKDMIAYSGYSLPILLEVLTNEKLDKEKVVKLIEDTHEFDLSRIDEIAIKESDDDFDL